ncbi:MAG: type II toxin-antitoxin system PemK/MazF family toxin [Candidatus Pacebacteria bacterium]|nr:type II toxin-antitoxin system PemK/MazF family toxin [Candidatus Paceibacterota bacterium]
MKQEHEKDFDKWNQLKKIIEEKDKNIFYKERDIFYVQLGKNIGYEQNGKNTDFARPVIILKKFNNDIFLCIPLTTKPKNNQFHFRFIFNNKENGAILSQIRLLDAKRLVNKKGVISNPDFKGLKRKISKLLKLTDFS